MTYQRVLLSGPSIDGAPGLPAALKGLSDADLENLSSAIKPCPTEFKGVGYFPIVSADDVPYGKVSSGQTVSMVDGNPKYVHTLVDADLSDLKSEKIEELASLRFEKETGGVTVGGAVIGTTERSQGLINGAYALALKNESTPGFSIDFKGAGGWVTLGAAQMIAIGEAVAAHIQNCFKRERELTDTINAAASASALQAIDITTGWPS